MTSAVASLWSGSLSHSSSLISPQQLTAPGHLLAFFSFVKRIGEAVDAHCYSEKYYLQCFLSVVFKLPFLSWRTYSPFSRTFWCMAPNAFCCRKWSHVLFCITPVCFHRILMCKFFKKAKQNPVKYCFPCCI